LRGVSNHEARPVSSSFETPGGRPQDEEKQKAKSPAEISAGPLMDTPIDPDQLQT
jgi:hypothetical protein